LKNPKNGLRAAIRRYGKSVFYKLGGAYVYFAEIDGFAFTKRRCATSKKYGGMPRAAPLWFTINNYRVKKFV
jgi:hypothetical protein